MSIRRSAFICFCVLLSSSVFPQRWYSSPVYNGRDVYSIQIFNQDTIIAAGGWVPPVSRSIAIFKTFNSAYLWHVLGNPTGYCIKSMDFVDQKEGIAVGAEGTILKTTNAGEEWSPQFPPVQRDFNKIFFIDAQNYIIAGGISRDSLQAGMQSILKSSDGGQTWNVVHDQPGFRLNSVNFPGLATGFAVGDSGTILKTSDGGDTWLPVAAPIIRDFNSIWFSDGNNGIIVGGNLSNDSIQTILRTTNGGSNWIVIRDMMGGWLTDVHFLNSDTGYVVGDQATLLKTIDGGQTWMPEFVDGSDTSDHYNTVRFYNENFGAIGGKWGRFFTYRNSQIPQVNTVGADVISANEVVLNGSISTFNESVQYDFIYSKDPSFTVAYQSIYAWTARSNAPYIARARYDDLDANTTYYYFLKAWTYGGASYGDTLSFFTGPPYIEFETLGINADDSSAILQGLVNNFQDLPVDLSFEYGTTPLLGTEIQASPAFVNDGSRYEITFHLDSLPIYTKYYFRLKGVAPSRNYYGSITTFFTGQPYKSIQTIAASNIADTTATLNGFIDGFLFPVINLSFEYGTSLSFGSTVMATPASVNDTLQHSVAATVSNLQPYRDYYFRLKAETTLETFYGNTVAFNSSLVFSAFQTLTASGITNNSAQLNGYVDSLNKPASLNFEYGTTQAFGNIVSAMPGNINDTMPHHISAVITGLQPNTIYYYRLKGTAGGTGFYGEERQFYTGNSGIPNWDFQDWQQDTFELAERWNIIGDDYERVPGVSGDALKLWNNTFALLGIVADDNPAFLGGVPFNARPDSIAAYLNYAFAPGDSGLILIHLYNANYDDISTNFIKFTGNTGGTFKRESFAISYNSGLMPDSLVIGFLPTIPELLGTPTNFLAIDNVEGVPASPVIANGDFERWFDYPHNTLLGWSYLKHIFINPANATDTPSVAQSLFNPPDDYAVEIRNRPLSGGRWISGDLSNQKSSFSKYQGGFPISARHQTLNGFYKWLPVNGDTMQITIDMFYQGQQIGRGELSQSAAATQFTELSVPINYNINTENLTPDTALIIIRSYKNPAKGPSRLIIDKLNFDGFLLDVNESPSTVSNPVDFIKIFPNPSSQLITIQLASYMSGEFSVFDLKGSSLYAGRFDGDKVELDIQNLKKGLYLIRISATEGRITKKFIVIR